MTLALRGSVASLSPCCHAHVPSVLLLYCCSSFYLSHGYVTPAAAAHALPLQSRVLHGVRQEILALSEIPFVKSHTARLLYKAGLRTPDAVAAVTSVDQIVAILSNGAPAG